MSSEKHTLVISPIGELDPAGRLLEHLGGEIREFFGYDTKVLPLLEEKDLTPDPLRNQVHSTAVLERLATLCPPEALKIMAITRVDLFIPILTHVYGEAQLGGKACILSTYRLTDGLSLDPEAFHCRIVKEAVHELGHTFNLRHCRDTTCVMHYCRSMKEVDRKSRALCRYCAVLLGDEIKRLEKAGSP